MTFVAPAQTADLRSLSLFGRRAAKPKHRILVSDEDGARRALGADGRMPPLAAAGGSLEHLARIALG